MRFQTTGRSELDDVDCAYRTWYMHGVVDAIFSECDGESRMHAAFERRWPGGSPEAEARAFASFRRGWNSVMTEAWE
jgi:hypothetical protein